MLGFMGLFPRLHLYLTQNRCLGKHYVSSRDWLQKIMHVGRRMFQRTVNVVGHFFRSEVLLTSKEFFVHNLVRFSIDARPVCSPQ